MLRKEITIDDDLVCVKIWKGYNRVGIKFYSFGPISWKLNKAHKWADKRIKDIEENL